MFLGLIFAKVKLTLLRTTIIWATPRHRGYVPSRDHMGLAWWLSFANVRKRSWCWLNGAGCQMSDQTKYIAIKIDILSATCAHNCTLDAPTCGLPFHVNSTIGRFFFRRPGSAVRSSTLLSEINRYRGVCLNDIF